jgi:anaerobic selenocysteine-containing dehydrogenase
MTKVAEVKRSQCYLSHANCGVLLTIKEGRVVKIKGDPDHPTNRGKLCERALNAIEWHYHPDRLNFPLKRAGQRGEGLWQRISWDQAVDEIAAKLKDIRAMYGPEALAHASGTGRTNSWDMVRFFNLFGSPNRFGAFNICRCPAFVIECATYGWMADAAPMDKTQCIVIWGKHPTQAGDFPIWWHLAPVLKKGPKLVVVDPRLTPEAKRADIWLQIRPGTDAALALGWLHVIIKEGLYDGEFVDRWTVGFPQLKQRVKEYTPEKVAAITWIAKEKIIESARMYARSKPAALYWGFATDGIGRNMSQANRAKAILKAITGNLDVEGGSQMASPVPFVADGEMALAEQLSPEQKAKQLGSERFRLQSWQGYELLCEAMKNYYGKQYPFAGGITGAHAPTVIRAMLTGKPYPVVALISHASNPLLNLNNSRLVYQALKRLELLVVHDYFLTPTAMLADYALPAADWMERPGMMAGGGMMDSFSYKERAIGPEFERKSDYDFFRGLGVRLGQEKFWPKTEEEVCGQRVAPMGLSYQDLREKRFYRPPQKYKKYEEPDPKTGQPRGFATPSGMVEIHSSILEKLGYDPLPFYEEPAESPISTPEVAEEYPLILTTGARFMPFYHTEHRQVATLRKKHPDPLVQIHPETARALGVAEGDWVWIATRRGKCRQRARLTDAVHPQVVSAQHGWWFPEMPAEEPWLGGWFMSNINVCTDDDPESCDPVNGAWSVKACLCKVYKAPWA